MGQFNWGARFYHASGLTEASEIQPIEFQNQLAVPIRSLTFWPVDGRPNLWIHGPYLVVHVFILPGILGNRIGIAVAMAAYLKYMLFFNSFLHT